MKILITGSNGFIGRNLSEYFCERYENVFCPKRANLDLVDTESVSAYVAKNNFDVIIHCGVSLASVEYNLKMYFNFEKSHKSFGKMICVGSGADYGPKNQVPPMVTEDFFGQYISNDIYGFSKYVIAKNIESDKKNIYNLRVFGIFGKYEDYRRRFISNNICRVLAGRDISMNKNMSFDYLYVNDFSRIVELFIKKEPQAKSYNICTATPVEFKTLAEIIQKVDGNKCSITIKERGSATSYGGSNELFLKEFGEFNFTGHETAIEELYRWYKNSSNIAFADMEFA